MSHWAVAPLDRQQITLFAPTLDETIVASHPVRLFDEVLRGIDFLQWESMYIRVVGQPPIHPRIKKKVEEEFLWVATAYNLMKLIRFKTTAALRAAAAVPAT